MKRKFHLSIAIIIKLLITLSSCSIDDLAQKDWLNPSLSYGTVTDQDGNSYSTILIGNQEWMAENLRTTTYCNGDIIPNVTDNNQWENLSTGAWSHFNNDSQYETPFGKLYNWFAVNDARNICPCGWHVPSDEEWTALTDYLGGDHVAGSKMRSADYWIDWWWDIESGLIPANNESGFSGLPGGGRAGPFFSMGEKGWWWSSTKDSTENLWLRGLHQSYGGLSRHNDGKGINGFSIRCLKN